MWGITCGGVTGRAVLTARGSDRMSSGYAPCVRVHARRPWMCTSARSHGIRAHRLRGGCIKRAGAVRRRVAHDGRALLWRDTGCDLHNPTTRTKRISYTQPVLPHQHLAVFTPHVRRPPLRLGKRCRVSSLGPAAIALQHLGQRRFCRRSQLSKVSSQRRHVVGPADACTRPEHRHRRGACWLIEVLRGNGVPV